MRASPESTDFRSFQNAFAARIRDPRGQARPAGVPARRMRVYEQLLFNNLEGFLLACFPITRRILGARAWRTLVRGFFVEHRCESPLFRDIPAQFLAWLEPRAAALQPRRPWLYEFMHYEWLELVVSADDAKERDDVDARGDLLTQRPVLHPTARIARYRYPVHSIAPGRGRCRPDATGYAYLVFRDGTDTVRFIRLNQLSARLLELLRDGDLTGRAALLTIAGELRLDGAITTDAGKMLLEELRRAGAVLGTRENSR